MECAQIANFVTKNDVAIQIKIKQLAKQYQVASSQKSVKSLPATGDNQGTVISDLDIQAEVMRLKGEMSIANAEIERLRGVLADENLAVPQVEKQEPVTRSSFPQGKPQTQ